MNALLGPLHTLVANSRKKGKCEELVDYSKTKPADNQGIVRDMHSVWDRRHTSLAPQTHTSRHDTEPSQEMLKKVLGAERLKQMRDCGVKIEFRKDPPAGQWIPFVSV